MSAALVLALASALLLVADAHLTGLYWMTWEGVLRAQEEATLSFYLQDPLDKYVQWKDLSEVHQSRMHVVVASETSDYILHTHPEWNYVQDEQDISMKVTMTPPHPGWYTLSFDFTLRRTDKLLASYLISLFDSQRYPDGRLNVTECRAFADHYAEVAGDVCQDRTKGSGRGVSHATLRQRLWQAGKQGSAVADLWQAIERRVLHGGWATRVYVPPLAEGDDTPLPLPFPAPDTTQPHPATTTLPVRSCFGRPQECSVTTLESSDPHLHMQLSFFPRSGECIAVEITIAGEELQPLLGAAAHVYLFPASSLQGTLPRVEHVHAVAGDKMVGVECTDPPLLPQELPAPPSRFRKAVFAANVSVFEASPRIVVQVRTGKGYVVTGVRQRDAKGPRVCMEGCQHPWAAVGDPPVCVRRSVRKGPKDDTTVCSDTDADAVMVTNLTGVRRALIGAVLEDGEFYVGAKYDGDGERYVWQDTNEALSEVLDFNRGSAFFWGLECVVMDASNAGAFIPSSCGESLHHVCVKPLADCAMNLGPEDEEEDIQPQKTGRRISPSVIVGSVFVLSALAVALCVGACLARRRVPGRERLHDCDDESSGPGNTSEPANEMEDMNPSDTDGVSASP